MTTGERPSDGLSVWATAKITAAQSAKLDRMAQQMNTTRSTVIRLLIDHATVDTVAAVRFDCRQEGDE